MKRKNKIKSTVNDLDINDMETGLSNKILCILDAH